MTTYTIHEFSEMNTHCSTYDDPNDCYDGTTDTKTLAITNATFTRTSVGTDSSGVEYYVYEPTYTSDSQSSHNGGDIKFFNPSGLELQSGAVKIPTARFSTSHTSSWTTGGPSTAATIIYLQLFADTGQTGNPVQKVPLKYDGLYDSNTMRGFSFVSSSNEPQNSSNNPVCLTDTCDILTPNGYVNVKDLSVGDLVTTPEGENVKITKVMKPTTHVAMGKALPHFIPKNSLGENKPSKDTFISKNHAYKSGDEWLCGQFNIEHNAINWNQDFVTYYNIMTEDYPKHTLVVNGIEMESWGGYEHNKPETYGNIKLRKEKLGFK